MPVCPSLEHVAGKNQRESMPIFEFSALDGSCTVLDCVGVGFSRQRCPEARADPGLCCPSTRSWAAPHPQKIKPEAGATRGRREKQSRKV